MSTHCEQIRDRLLRAHIRVDEEWLTECVEYFVNDEPTIGIDELHDKTMEQWRLSDLADIGIACLPAAVDETATATLASKYVLQLLFVIDISESAYDQLRMLYNKQIDLTDGEKLEFKANVPKKKRSLKLQLTDGHRQVVALEYRPIAALHTKLAPGCKLLLSGPLRLLNGVLLLEPQHVQLLGGEVAKYEVENAFENVLLRQLGRPLNPQPRSDYNEQRVVEEARDAHNLAALREQHRQSQLIKASQQTTADAAAAAAASAMANFNDSDDIFGDDDMLAEVNLDLAAAEHGHQQSRPPATVVDLSDDDDDDLMAAASAAAAAEQSQSEAAAPTAPPQPSSSSASYDDFDAEVYNEDDEAFARAAYEDELRREIQNATPPAPSPPRRPPAANILAASYPFRIQGCNLVSIRQLQQHCTGAARSQPHPPFIIRAEVVSVFEKLQVKATGWRIGVVCRDASGATMRVRFGDAVLNALTGTSAEELHQMRRQAKERPQTLETIADILGTFKQTLQQLQCFLKIPTEETSPSADDAADDVPFVTQLVRSAPVLERILAAKLAAEQYAQ